MKKIFLSILLTILLLPIIVNADSPSIGKISIIPELKTGKKFYFSLPIDNSELSIPKIEFNYDSEYFSLTKDSVVISYCQNNLTNDPDIKILFTHDKITIYSKGALSTKYECLTDNGMMHIQYALIGTKVGITHINVNAPDYMYEGKKADFSYNVKITEDPSYVGEDGCPKCQECANYEESYCPPEKECPICEEPTKCNCNDMFYIKIIAGLGGIILVLLFLIPHLLGRQKKKYSSTVDNLPPELKQ